jgi:hypothetical protein
MRLFRVAVPAAVALVLLTAGPAAADPAPVLIGGFLIGAAA